MSVSPPTAGPATSAELVCPLCGGGRTRPLFRAAAGWPIVRCTACTLAFTDDRDAPPPSALYPPFDQSDGAALGWVRSALSVFTRQRAALLDAVKPGGGRLLDFGCGAGAFARWMSERGWDVVGLEPFSLGPTVERERLRLVRKPLEEAAGELGTFDAITLWQVLEHLHRPVDTLRALVAHLAPGGVVVVSVPNFASWQSRAFAGRWFHLDPPRHLLHFEPRTLDACLVRAGLEIVAHRRFLPEYGTSGWVQSALNAVLPHPNFLYEAVKDRGQLRGTPRGKAAALLAASVALAVPLAALSLPIEAAATRGDRQAALTVVARRAGG